MQNKLFDKLKNFLKKFLITVVVLGGIAFFYVDIYGNFHKIDDNAYRSGQLNEYNLPYYLKKHEIKTVLNLRGFSKDTWYLKELAISKELNVTHIDYKMSSSKFYDLNQTKEILNVLQNAQKPILIHCLGGADRTSLVSAIYEYGVAKSSAEVAKKQLSWYYGHIPSFKKDKQMMDDRFEQFIVNFNNDDH